MFAVVGAAIVHLHRIKPDLTVRVGVCIITHYFYIWCSIGILNYDFIRYYLQRRLDVWRARMRLKMAFYPFCMCSFPPLTKLGMPFVEIFGTDFHSRS